MKQVKLIQHPTDELDVAAIFRNALLFFRHYGKLLLAVALVGTMLGAFRFWQTPNLYSSTMVLHPAMLSDPEQIALIDNWSLLLKKKEWLVLAQQFRLDGLIRLGLAAKGDPREVIGDREARYFGALLGERTL